MSSPRRAPWLGIALGLALAAGGPLLAQTTDNPFDTSGSAPISGGASTAWLSLPIKFGIFVFLAVTALVVCYFVVFPGLLKKARPAWPLDAYGRASALAWAAVWGLALAIFWDDLVLSRIMKVRLGGSGVAEEYALRAIVLAVAVVGVVLMLTFFRSRNRGPVAPAS